MLKKKRTKEREQLYNIIAHPGHQVKYFQNIPPNQQGFLLLQLPRGVQKKILKHTTDNQISAMLDYLDPDQATDILQIIDDAARRENILKKMTADIEKKVTFLLRFQPNTAAGIMDLNYVQASKDATFKQIAGIIEEHEKRTGKIPTVLVVEDGILLGEIPISTLVLQNKRAIVAPYIKKTPTVHYKLNTNKVLRLINDTPHSKIVVLDDHKTVLGIIYSDDIINVLKKKSGKNLYDFAGVKHDERVFDPFYIKVKYRYKWLIINLGTAYLAAGVVSLFEDTISKFVLLATYMPIVAGMGGNTATQTLAVMVRGIALGEISLKNCWKAVLNEVGSGVTNGVINGLIVAVIAILWNQSLMLGVITAAAMITNLAVAGLAGSLIPLIMKKFNKDPATSATIFITTATDVCGFFTFLGLASILLK